MFCNDVDINGKVTNTHSCAEQVVIAARDAFGTLYRRQRPPAHELALGRVHTIQPVSQLSLVTTDYTPGPFARPGGLFTVDVGNIGGGVGRPSRTARAATSHISLMDPGESVIKMQLPGPERDGPYGVLKAKPEHARRVVEK